MISLFVFIFKIRVIHRAYTFFVLRKCHQTKDERVKQVYRIKLTIAGNPGQRLTPGIPADVVIRTDPAAAWRRPKW